MNIAIYGKGGIGKSTIATCVSVMLARQGKDILQIGCDPKHDSTLSLLEGKEITTVIDSLNDDEISEDKIIVKGLHEIDCVEIGGPEPGVGCAGRGIITGLNKLEKMKKYNEKCYAHIVYDVLGDVVCGGFFEPLKKKKVEKMYIVTSGEFNSLFAANNLCKGYINCGLENKGISLSGIIANCRGIPNEEEIIRSFCQKVNVPLITIVPRDNMIEKCTIEGTNIIDKFQNSFVSRCIERIVKDIENEKNFYDIHILSLDELRNLYKEMVS